jgi:hypothetical protein
VCAPESEGAHAVWPVHLPLQLANVFAILGPSTPNSLGIWDTVTITSYMLHHAPGRHVAGGHWVVGGGILLPTAPVAPSFNPLAPQSVARGPLTGRRALNLP